MFRLSKLTDYGIVLLAHLAREADAATATPHNARELAEQTHFPAPAVSKVLKALAREGVLESHRGTKGGFTLARRPEDISVADMIYALEGPVAMTQCAVGLHLCAHEGSCAVRDPWQVINSVVVDSLSQITLAHLVDPTFTAASKLLGAREQPTPRPSPSPSSTIDVK